MSDDYQDDEPGTEVAVPGGDAARPRLSVVRDEDEERALSEDLPQPPRGLAVIEAPVAQPGERKAIIPPQFTRENIRGTILVWLALTWHRFRYHGIRVIFAYLPALAFWSLAGLLRGLVLLVNWARVAEGVPLEQLAADNEDSREWMRVRKANDERRKARLLLIAIAGGAAAIGGYVFYRVGRAWEWCTAGAVVLLILSRAGRPEGHRIVSQAVVPPEYEVPTPEVITRGLASLGISALEKAATAGGLQFVSDVHRDGPGWGVQLDLPFGVTPSMVIARRARLASGLRRPLSATWPEGVEGEHEGRLSLWIGFHDMAKMKQPKHPLLKAGTADVFASVPFGTDPRLRPVTAQLFETNWLIGASPGAGKALALDTPVPTPDGWSTMGALHDGDIVFGSDGRRCKVVRAWAVRHDRPCYEVKFSDGSVIVADAEHLWLAETRASRVAAKNEAKPKRRDSPLSRDQRHKMALPAVLTTEQMSRSVRVGTEGRLNYSVLVAQPLQMDDSRLPVPPYALGAWLGDGASAIGRIYSVDREILGEIEAEGMAARLIPSTIVGGACPGYRIEGLTAGLRELGLILNKHIPLTYLRSSEAQRRALLAGLLDTDGYCAKTGVVEFGSTCERLARDVHHLVATLGYKATIRSKVARLRGKDCGTSWTVSFTPADKVFRLPRKAARQVTAARATAERRFITSIRPVPSVPVRCITVDSADSLYLVGESCIPTHNTNVVRNILAAASLDVLCDLWVHELSGKGDLEPFAQDSHRYCSGMDDDSVAYAAESIRQLRAELERRQKKFKGIDRADKPDGKLTRALAEAGVRPILAAFDEVQVLFLHPEYGGQAAADLAHLMRLARAYGIIIVLSTQRPDKDSVPTAISGIVTCRCCLKVPDYLSNDLVLGTGSYKAGYDATIFRAVTDSGLCWLKSESGPRVVRTYYLDLKDSEKIAARARQLRQRAGVLTGYAIGLDDEAAPQRDVLADVLAVLGDRPGMHWGVLAEGLALRFPERWHGVTAEAISAQCRNAGVPSVDVSMSGVVLKGCRKAGVVRKMAQ